MRSYTVIGFLALCTLAITVAGFPQDSIPDSPSDAASLLDDLPKESDAADVEIYRPKRATCDLTEAWGWGSTACAAHCIARGYRGGYCNNRRICVCRR
ncbi:defensin-A-like [Armigeres subalbatus]|uniref:defensin-A-like n=1 Tax=Armigeres subalbatus TaxID=124917 RepID=UPI002ED0B92A